MYAYHIDRLDLLKVGQEIRPKKFSDIKPIQLNSFLNKRYSKGLSRHGEQYFASPPSQNSDIYNHFYELIFEYERQLNFPKLPSRFESFFACESLKDVDKWIDFLNLKDPKIVEVYYSSHRAKTFDARLMNGESFESYSNIKESYLANLYWKHEKSDNPLPELLIPDGVRVTKII